MNAPHTRPAVSAHATSCIGRLRRATITVGCLAMLALAASADDTDNAFFGLSLEELMNEPLREVASFTGTTRRDVPAAVTRVDSDDIATSGARDLMELLDIYVPGVQWAQHGWEPKHLGTRGIISDREDKVMIRVNGHVMNERTHAGAITERDFPMMDDIDYIDVIRGPGSAVYGLGAVSMIIDIHTRTGKTTSGSTITVKAGAGMEFAAVSAQTTFKLPGGFDAYLYMGGAYVNGADSDDAPVYYGPEFTDRDGNIVGAGDTYDGGAANDGAQYRDLPPLKLHFQATGEKLDFWVRFTRGGEKQTDPINIAAAPPAGSRITATSVDVGEDPAHGYQQFSAGVEYRHDLTDKIESVTTISGDITDWERTIPLEATDNHREDEIRIRQMFHIQPNGKHSLAFGAAAAYERFGLETIGHPEGDPSASRFTSSGLEMEDWDATTVSLIAEWQWAFAEDWKLILGNRCDKNTYSDWMHSPRASLMFMPNERNAFKLMLTRSMRMGFAEELRVADLLSDDQDTDPEQLDAIELRYEHNAETWFFASSMFYYDMDVIGWDSPAASSTITGTQRQYGLELEVEKRWKKTRLRASHAITQLDEFELLDGKSTYITAAPYGYGNDLCCWSNQVSKIVLDHEFTEKWRGHLAVRVYWDYDGYEDWVAYRDTVRSDRTEPDLDEAYTASVYFNVGTSYRMRENVLCSLNAYNLLGVFDESLNKRPFVASYGGYRSEAPSVALTVSVSF